VDAYHAGLTTCFQKLTRSWCCSPVCARALSVHASLVMHEALANMSSLLKSSVRDVVRFRQACHSHLCDVHGTRVRCENALGHVPVVSVVLQVVVLDGEGLGHLNHRPTLDGLSELRKRQQHT